MSYTSVCVSRGTRDALYHFKDPEESYEQFLRRVFDIDESVERAGAYERVADVSAGSSVPDGAEELAKNHNSGAVEN